MLAKLIFAPEAEKDISEAYSWHETRRFGLGEEFLSCVDAGIQKIRRDPELHPVVYEEYRRVLIRRFPYAVFYEYLNKTIWIYSIFHTSRDPEKWRNRMI